MSGLEGGCREKAGTRNTGIRDLAVQPTLLSMDRFIRFSGTGAHLLWRVKNGAKSVPFKTLDVLKDGSELVLLRESNGMRSRRRKTAGDPALPPLPDTIARLGRLTRLTPPPRGRRKTAPAKLL